MADSLEYSELEILEEFIFEEEIQRPLETRFFTLEDQLLDYFDKVLPKHKAITKFEYSQKEKEVERVRTLYNKTVRLLDAVYTTNLIRNSVSVSWISPIYSNYKYKSYSFAKEWNPLSEPTNRSLPNFYPKMIGALPSPYNSVEDGNLVTTNTIAVNEEGANEIHVLGNFIRSKGIIHEDGKLSVESLQLANTNDDIKTKGFFLQKRGVDIPNKFKNHDFFETEEPHAIKTDKSLLEIFPTLEAILTHGIPKTTDPYVEGLKYLKVYDLTLEDVTWNLWNKQFQPEEQISDQYKPTELKFPESNENKKPSEEVEKLYRTKWSSGIHPRLWLMNQEDNGNLILKMLLSEEGNTTRIPPTIIGEKLETKFPVSLPEDCLRINTFSEFLQSGVYRSTNKTCVPVDHIKQEKKFMNVDKIAWTDTEGDSILKKQQQLLKVFQSIKRKQKGPKYEVIRGKKDSELRKDVRIILQDPERDDKDKAYHIELLVRELTKTNELFLDASESFVVCAHTISQLKGDFETDNIKFYEQWTSVVDGFRVCKYCSEQINSDVFVAQDDFDENGQVLKNYDVLDSKEYEFHTHSFNNSLLNLRPLFDLENASQSILYLLLSLLQVLPKKDQLQPILDFSVKLTPLINKQPEVHKGAFGIALMVTLMQIHDPFLIPRRSFGSKILKLTGYPRDTTDDKISPIVDTIISILKTTFESTPNTFNAGPIKTLFKQILINQKEVRKTVVQYLKLLSSKDFKLKFEEAAKRYSQIPLQEEIVQLGLPLILITKPTFKPLERQGEEELMGTCLIYRPKTFLSGRLPPSVLQKKLLIFKTNIKTSKTAKEVLKTSQPSKLIALEKSEIAKNSKKKLSSQIKSPKLQEFMKSEKIDGIGYLSLLQKLLDFFSLETKNRYEEVRIKSVYLNSFEDQSLFRDSAKSLVLELLSEVKDSESKKLNEFLENNVTLKMLLITPKEAETQNIELRAKERETFKQRMRSLDDEQRETTKMLLDIGIASFIITNEDRRRFAEEYNYTELDLEGPILELPVDEKQNWNDNEQTNINIENYGEYTKPIDNGDYGSNNNTFGDEEAW